MKPSIQLGPNKTGLGMAPLQSTKLLDGQDDAFKSFAQADEDPMQELTFKEIRQEYLRESGTIGSLPPPMTVKGAAVTGFQKITGRHPEVLIDKLGERLAFERSGARLYESFIAKCEVALPKERLGFLQDIHADEVRHFRMLYEVIKELGADPTAITPCADVAGVASKGLIDVVNDPRTSVTQAAEAILIAELTDVDSWDLLIKLTEQAGLDAITERFREAQLAEERHLIQIREWLEQMIMANDVVPYKGENAVQLQ